MLDYLKSIDPILTILLGWLLGCFTPVIHERIRRPQRRRELIQAILEEMLGLQYTMAGVAHNVRARYGIVSDAFLDKILPIIGEYKGPDRIERLAEHLATIRRLPEMQRSAAQQFLQDPNVGMGLKRYDLPFTATQMGEFTICRLDFQRSVSRIRFHLDLFNQCVPYTQALLLKTFDKPSTGDREALITNQEGAYRDAGRRAEIIMDAIGELMRQYGKVK